MKLKLLLLSFSLFCFGVCAAQFGSQQIISTTTDGAYFSLPFDIDADGFTDVLTTGVGDHLLSWYRNLDGEGNFGPEILISNATAYFYSIDFVDLDNDGDKDLIYLRNNPRNVAWLENIDGLGSFGPEQMIIENQPDYIMSIKPADLDNDGDLDLIVTRTDTFEDKIDWYENLDSLGNFGEENTLIDGEGLIVGTIRLVDINLDGHLDILTSHEYFSGPGRLVWYKNLGNVVFDVERLIYQFEFLFSDWTSITHVQYTDINTDGKTDITISTNNDDIGFFYYWFEHIDNLGNFGERQSLPISGKFCDIDNDGDNDILTGHYQGNLIYWVENSDGQGTFTTERTITTEIDFLRHVDTADFNGDGLLDVVSASIADDKVAWYENTGILGMEETTIQKATLYPNPTKDFIHIISSETIASVEIWNVRGSKIQAIQNKTEIDLSHLVSGIYLFKIVNENGASEIHKVIKE